MNIKIVKSKKAGSRPATMTRDKIFSKNGKVSFVYSANTSSPNIGEELLYAFQKSVDKARKQTKVITKGQ